ncbi:MAG: SusE domain-containing protein [Salinimicrobium sediminis]|nr:SusE domain-containing protein [Salinimicrobium sediminis]
MNTFLPPYTLKPSNASGLADRFVWNEVDMDVQTTVRYELQASADESFQNMTVIESDIATTNQAVTVGELLALAEEAGLDTDPDTEASNSGTVYFQVRAYAGENPATTVEQFSEPVGITVELVEDTSGEVELPKIYVVGNFQGAGGFGSDWTPVDGVPLAVSGVGKTDYEGFVYLNVDKPEYKFLPSKTLKKFLVDYELSPGLNAILLQNRLPKLSGNYPRFIIPGYKVLKMSFLIPV